MRTQVQILFRMLEDFAVWAAFGAIVVIALTLWLAPGSARSRLKGALFFLVAGAVLTTIGHAASIRLARYIGVVAISVSLVRATLILLFDAVPLLRGTPKIVRDIGGGVVYFVAFMVVLRGAGVKLDSILTTSALLTAVVGFALQDTLGNLVAGLALQAQRPFSVGDWIEVQGSGQPAGRVLEINWRATTVLTLDQFEVSFPNSVLAKTPVTNYSKPTTPTRRELFVNAAYGQAPDRVCEILAKAVRETEGVLDDPPVSVLIRRFDSSGPEYWVRYFIGDYAKRDVIDSRAHNRIWYALRRASVDIPYPTQTLLHHEMSDERTARERTKSVEQRLEALRKVDFLGPVPDEDLRRLAELVRAVSFTAGETVLQQGETGDSFFLIRSGEIAVEAAGSDGISREVARLGPGQFFGEMSLMTGEPRSASIRALSRAEMYEIDHECFRAVLMGHEEVAAKMSSILAARQVALGDRTSSPGEPGSAVERRSELLLSRIKRFFHL